MKKPSRAASVAYFLGGILAISVLITVCGLLVKVIVKLFMLGFDAWR